jgi:catechol 2,3-dioxygenase-like lactoylglutathione lyase family enzyme
MDSLSRRHVLGLGLAALAATLPSRSGGAADDPHFVERTWPTNPMNACGCLNTIVTADIEGSVRFYCELLGYEVVRRGTLGSQRPSVAGAGRAGRPYVLIRTNPTGNASIGMIRLLAAPEGAAPNRPRPAATIESPGLCALSLMSRDIAATHERLTGAGIEAVSEPYYYNHLNMVPLPGARYRSRDIHVKTFVVYAPSTEQVFFTQVLDIDGRPMRWEYPGLHSPVMGRGLVALDKWPVRRFYRELFELLPDRDAAVWGQPNFNKLMGSTPDVPMLFGGMGDGFNMEVWEWRHLDPVKTPTFPTYLDRLGYAATTVLVDDLAEVRRRARVSNTPVLGEGALPTLEAEYQDGLYVRGAVGELIEVIGRGNATS